MIMSVNDIGVAEQECTQLTAHDLDQIWQWNHELPTTHTFCMHDKISEQARNLPHKVAVTAWDGDLTYMQIDQYSTLIAGALRQAGVRLHDILPICFEKSVWTIVAVMAVMKAGAAFVLMDPTLPLARLQNMAEQVGVKAILTSRKQHDLSTVIVPGAELFVIDADSCTSMSSLQHDQELPEIPPSALMYITFTSGSTGVPKGVMISHKTYSSSALPRAKAVGYTEDSRVLDFASYAFDVSIDSMLLTLSNGGCLCIPSDEDRLNDINGVIQKMKVNYAGLTPSVARILDADVISSLAMLGLGGEAVTARDVNRWGQITRIVIGYGPCECTIGCTINSSAATGRDYISIGRGNGANIWIVDPEDHEILMPVGTVGELLVEGPIVGEGYLHDPIKTQAAFINDPSWLVSGHRKHAGRRGRLYKSGDLVRYDPNGSSDVVFVGRKDTQVKLRGQRVELGEVEWQLQAVLPSGTNVVAEVVVPKQNGEQPMLMAFITSTSINRQDVSRTELEIARLSDELQEALSRVEPELEKILPRYMIPTAYIPVNYIPVLISGKTDRKRLRAFGAVIDLQQLEKQTAEITSEQFNDLERRLLRAWSQTLGLGEEKIRPSSNFFSLGGDSVAAMKLVSVCREHGLDLTVVGVFSYPTLSAMSEFAQLQEAQVPLEVPAFSMISQTAESACIEAAEACQSHSALIEDIYPCTPGQESLFTFSIKSTTPYIAQRIARVPEHVSLDGWKTAWEKTVAGTPILRTRLIQTEEPRLRQVVLRESISWRYSSNLAQYLDQDQHERMGLGQSLVRYAIIEDEDDGKRYMVWTIHHAVYDGWSEPLILRKVSKALQNQQFETATQMKDLVKHLREANEAHMQEFWKRELAGAVGPQFPDLPHRDYMPTANAQLERQLSFSIDTGSPFTMATYIRGALSLVISQYTGSDDVVLSETLTGREIPLAGVQSIEGPLITTLPIRIRINGSDTIEVYLQRIQLSIAARASYEHFGVQNIRRVSRDAQYACEARTGLVIQPKSDYTGNDIGFEQADTVHEALKFNPYPLMIAFETSMEGLRVCASFDDSVISMSQVERFLAQLETVCSQLTRQLDRQISTLSYASSIDLERIWRWNGTPPLSFEKISRKFRADQNLKLGSMYPPTIIPWVCNPHNPSSLSPIGCVGELWLEGALLSGETDEAPAWLSAGYAGHIGRTSRVQPTGDLVRLQENGDLMFISRKEDVLSVLGHELNVLDLEAHFSNYLLPGIQAVAAAYEIPANEIEDAQRHELVALVEQQPHSRSSVSLMLSDYVVRHQVTDTLCYEMTVCATASSNLVEQLKKLDRSLRSALPPYMVPTAYLVVDKVPEGVDRNLLNQLVSKITPLVIHELTKSLEKAWTSSSMQSSLTPAETILRTAWAEVLKIKQEQIDPDDNFFRLGADSVLAMRLVSNLRAQGYVLSVVDIFQNMRLRDAARVMRSEQVEKPKPQPYKAFSTVPDTTTAAWRRGDMQPKLSDPTWSVQDIMPVTDTQVLDVKATIQLPRTSVQYTMLYFDTPINKDQLNRAYKDLVKTHDILRTVFIEHESRMFQVVLKEIDASVVVCRTESDVTKYVGNHCKEDVKSDLLLGSLFLKSFYIEGEHGQSCLVLRLSHAQYDGTSLPLILRDLEALCAGGKVAVSEPFSTYMARIGDTNLQSEAVNYWRGLLDGSSLSVLTRTPAQAEDKSIFLEQTIDISPRTKEITTANLMVAVWALVLAKHLCITDVTFGAVTSGRRLDMLNADKVMGPCHQFTPIRVPFQPDWTAMDLMRFVQKQTAESAAHDFLGFEKISKKCTNWSPEVRCFDSIIHHQDFEDFDTMPFAGGHCAVDILNPYGDAAYPLKVASYSREGQFHVGVVGSERERTFVQMILGEVVAAVHNLMVETPELMPLRVTTGWLQPC